MNELDRLRDHAQERANWQPGDPKAACRDRTAFGTPKPGDPKAACRDRTAFGTPKPADHVNCGGGTCGCRCHEPTPAERALWRQIAGEIDDYLDGAADDGQEALL